METSHLGDCHLQSCFQLINLYAAPGGEERVQFPQFADCTVAFQASVH